MAKIDLNNMEGVYFDVLREIGNIGAGNATTALATMIGTKVDMRVPKVGLMEFKEIGAEMGGEETIMAGIYQQIRGDISGSIMFLLEEKSARVLVSNELETLGVKNLFAIGDGAGVTRGLMQASASGVHVARVIADR